MESNDFESVHILESCSYRFLQRKAKSMGLPSNVKKIQLIELIKANIFGSPTELDRVVAKVKQERYETAQMRKKKKPKQKTRVQGFEISSTSDHTYSPPGGNMSQFNASGNCSASLLRKPSAKLNRPPASEALQIVKSYCNKPSSERVLRNRTYVVTEQGIQKKDQFRSIIDIDPVVGVARKRNAPRRTLFQSNTVTDLSPKQMNGSVMKRYSPSTSNTSILKRSALSIVVSRYDPSHSNYETKTTTNRKRKVSGIYPLEIPETINPREYGMAGNACTIRNEDGTRTKVPVFIRKTKSPNIAKFVKQPEAFAKTTEVVTRPETNKPIQHVPKPEIVSRPDTIAKKPEVYAKKAEIYGRNVKAENYNFSIQDIIDNKINIEALDTSAKVIISENSVNSNADSNYLSSSMSTNLSSESVTLLYESTFLKNKMAQSVEYTAYCHKQFNQMVVRNEAVLVNEPLAPNVGGGMNLPRIGQVFSKFDYVPPDTQPSYLQDSAVPDNSAAFPRYDSLEPMYNYKLSNLREPLTLPAIRTASTFCTDSSEYAATPRTQVCGDVSVDFLPALTSMKSSELTYSVAAIALKPIRHQDSSPHYKVHAYEQNNYGAVNNQQFGSLYQPGAAVGEQRNQCSQAYEQNSYAVASNQNYGQKYQPETESSDQYNQFSQECLNNSGSTTTSLQFLASQVSELSSAESISLASVSLCDEEMVEDALELISQDGDYMERIGMDQVDQSMRCVVCPWAGSKATLEQHIRQEHSAIIHKAASSDWNITFTLGELLSQSLWKCQLMEASDGHIYVLSVHYTQTDCLHANISTLSFSNETTKRGSITIYNRVTGEPYFWEGEIPHTPPTLPYDNHPNCLIVEVSKLELIPNNADLVLINGKLVSKFPGNVVCGQPELDQVHIILFVKVE